MTLTKPEDFEILLQFQPIVVTGFQLHHSDQGVLANKVFAILKIPQFFDWLVL